MKIYEKYQQELKRLELGESQYEWDELEELITDDFEEEKLTSEEYDSLMRLMMDMEME